MSASEDSTVTYTAVSSSFEGLSNIGSPRVDGPPMMPEDPYAYVVAVFQAPPSPDYVLARRSQSRHHLYQSLFLSRYTWSLCHRRMIYSQLRSEQPLPATVSPTADSPGSPLWGGTRMMMSDEDDGEVEAHPLRQYYVHHHQITWYYSLDILPAQALDTTSGTPPLLPIPLPTPSPPLLLPFTDRRADRPEVCLPPRKRLCIAQGPRYDVGESSSAPRPTRGFRAYYGFVATLDVEIRRDPERAIGYGITDTWDDMLVGMPGAPATDDTTVGSTGWDRRRLDFLREAWGTGLWLLRDVPVSEVMALRLQSKGLFPKRKHVPMNFLYEISLAVMIASHMLRASAINNPKDELNHLHHMKQIQMEEWIVWLPISEWVLATLNLNFATTEVVPKFLDFAVTGL
ncbi:hypothetical protein Tco_1313496 [Tanacetum coccineum]